jgi:Xaa-Pro dipeptidase
MLDSDIPVIKKTLQQMGLDKGRIGCELGREQYMWMSFDGFMKLQKELSRANFVDASDVLLAMRSVKSDLEVDRIRKAARAASRGAEKTFEDMKPGMTERQIEKLLRINIMMEGADDVYRVFTSSGMDFTKPFSREATERKVNSGDQLHFDIIAEYRYYYCDITRDAFLGHASDESKRIWELMRHLHKFCLKALKPGIEIRDLATACLEGIEDVKRDDPELGSQFDGLKTSLTVVGRMGHGIGCDGTEYPSIALWEKGFKVKPQMTFAVNPNLKTPYGFFNTEDNVLVTEQGWELLSTPGIKDDPPIY